MELLLLLLPLLGAATPLLGGRLLGVRWSTYLPTGLMGVAALLSFSLLFTTGFNRIVWITPVGSWLSAGDLRVVWEFCFDPLSGVVLCVVLSISFLVHLYSLDYMEGDPHKPRFFGYLSLFAFFMVVLIGAANLPVLFVGWEGVGVCSYLLINFWFSRRQANKSALKAMAFNRVGDFGLLIGMFLLYRGFRTLDFSTLFLLAPTASEVTVRLFGFELPLLSSIAAALFLGAVGKSAQLGLHLWLPDAMEGPTPVSSLLHAATMVIAGVYLLIRCSPLLEYAPSVLQLIGVVGGLTALFGATAGLFQNDLKRVIAYSTCSQIGYMVFCCGASAYSVALFHLYNHAFFKALLFLGAGVVIHAFADEQDMRRMGGLVRLLPYTYTLMVVGSLSLMGIPFLTGFYSKDLILEVVAGSPTPAGWFSALVGNLAALFTAFYSIRLLYLVFLSPPRGFREVYSPVGLHEASPFMLGATLPLFFGSIFIGYLSRDLFVGLGTDFWGAALFNLPTSVAVSSEFLPISIKLLPVGLTLLGGALSLLLHLLLFERGAVLPAAGRLSALFRFLVRRWYFDPLYNRLFVESGFRLGYTTTFKLLDRGVVEWFGPTGLSRSISSLSARYSAVHSGYLYHYLFLMVGGAALLLGWWSYALPIKPAVLLLLLLLLRR